MRIRRTAAVLMMTAVALVAAVTVPASAAPRATAPLPPGGGLVARSAGVRAQADPSGPICYFGACYDYVAARQSVAASGASVLTLQAKPELDPADPDGHSLQELAVQSADAQQIVEVGWTVDKGLNGDTAPHLFVYHWVDGVPTCYNGCGFVPTSRVFTAGMRLLPGLPAQIGIRYARDAWRITYDGVEVGYFPGSLWQGRYTRAGLIQIFGEVAAANTTGCTDMGDGVPGASPFSSWFAGLTYVDGAAPVSLSTLVTSPQAYSIGRVRTTSYHLGGPGTGRCANAGTR